MYMHYMIAYYTTACLATYDMSYYDIVSSDIL